MKKRRRRNFMSRKERIEMVKTIGIVIWIVCFTIIALMGCTGGFQ